MEITAIFLLLITSLIGFLAVFFTSFGTMIIMLGAVGYSFLTDFQVLTWPVLVVLFTLYLAGEVFEYLLVVIAAKKWGASNWAVVGAIIGGILGAVLGTTLFGVGIILGTFLGIFLGAFIIEFFIKGDLKQSLKAGAGSLLGRVGSIVLKVFIAIVMFIMMGIKIYATSGI